MATSCTYFTRRNIDQIPGFLRLHPDIREAVLAVSAVLPFRVNQYVVERLIDWDAAPDDPLFQLTIPQAGMLSPDDLDLMLQLVRRGADDATLRTHARAVQGRLNPHPAGQMTLNVPEYEGSRLPGVQHKYRETVLFFPAQGQTCHAYCTYCFRWAQFVGDKEQRFAQREVESLIGYLRTKPDVSDVLITGGDPMVMRTRVLRRYIEPLLEVESVRSIRFGTKATAYWPQRFVSDGDADDLMALFEQIVAAGKHLALMAHFSHPRELAPDEAQAAIRRIRSTGAVVRSQAPLIARVNDSARVWRDMWTSQVALGIVPYYMFVERDTGPKNYFEVPLARALAIYGRAYREVSGLARTVRGPSMSATPGKVAVVGITEHGDEDLFVLKMFQARNPDWVGRTFLAEFDREATWLDELQPAGGADRFFFEDQPRSRGPRRESRDPVPLVS